MLDKCVMLHSLQKKASQSLTCAGTKIKSIRKVTAPLFSTKQGHGGNARRPSEIQRIKRNNPDCCTLGSLTVGVISSICYLTSIVYSFLQIRVTTFFAL